jgi:hypothetical protein
MNFTQRRWPNVRDKQPETFAGHCFQAIAPLMGLLKLSMKSASLSIHVAERMRKDAP